MILDLTNPVEQSQDLGLLREILAALVGQPCLKAEFSHGGELKVHFGNPIPYTNKKMAHKTRGSWRLNTRASGWRLVLADSGLAITSFDPPPYWRDLGPRPITDTEIEQKAKHSLAGQPVARAFPILTPAWAIRGAGIGVSILFANGSTFTVLPSDEPDEGDGEPLADWELFTPFNTYLRAGPGQVWSYLRSDVQAVTA